MEEILTGVVLLSVLHALIPSHWLPLIALSRAQQWTPKETMRITFFLSVSHILSTLLLGVSLSFLGQSLNAGFEGLVTLVGPILLIVFGVYFVYRHHHHKHFHIDDELLGNAKTRKQIVYALMAFMFLAPCMEILPYFFASGPHGWYFVLVCVLVYSIVSLLGMLVWVYVALHGMQRMNWHKLEHNAGLITGSVMVLTGVISLIQGH